MERMARNLPPDKSVFRRLWDPVDKWIHASLYGDVFLHYFIRTYVILSENGGFRDSAGCFGFGEAELIECCLGVCYEHELSDVLYGASDEFLVLCRVDNTADWTREQWGSE